MFDSPYTAGTVIISHNLRFRHVLHATGPSMFYFSALSIGAYVFHFELKILEVIIPFNAIATLSAALAIYLGFKANQAYDRWWEGRKIWGLLVNYSRGFGREVLTFVDPQLDGDPDEIHRWQIRVLKRHIAFVHALRVFLRKPNGFVRREEDLLQPANTYDDVADFLEPAEYEATIDKKNPPNYLLLLQGTSLSEAKRRGWLTDYQFVQMSKTLTEFNNHQGRAERIKNTPLPRPYSFYSRVFVYLHGTLVPLAFIEALTWFNIPLSLTINFVFLTLDLVGQYTEDPFENRIADVPLTSIALTIEENIKEMARIEVRTPPLPKKPAPVEGVVF